MGSDIYALCDMELLRSFGIAIEEYAAIAKMYGCEIIQYRDKNANFLLRWENLKRLRKAWDGVLLVNDEVALARLCDGVHLGQEDLAALVRNFGLASLSEGVMVVRKFIGAKIVGLSTHSSEEIAKANELELDYIGLGAYRKSGTKEVVNILGDHLAELALLSKHPVVAIGGIAVFEPIANVWKRAVGRDLLIKALSYA